MTAERSSSKRPVLIVGIVAVAIVITLMLGVIFLQAGSNVSEVSMSSTTSSLSTSSSNEITQVGSSSSAVTSTSSSYTYYGPTGILGVSLTDPPIVPPGVTDVYISYSSVQVHVADAGNEDGWYQVADNGSVDLMSLVNVSLTLGSAEVQTGVFNLIEFNITSAAVTLNGANVTAYVPASRINVPIIGGISVSTGNSSGVLVDLSPEVIPYQNGTSVSYVLVPEARSLPIPRSVWNRGLDIKGATLQEVQNQTWVTNSTGQVTVSGVTVSPDSFSITLQNQGSQNVSFSSIVIGQVISLPECYATPNGGSPRPADANNSYVSIRPLQSSFIGNETIYLLGHVYPTPAASNASASIVVTDPNGNVVESLNSTVELSGAFYAYFIAGGSWVGGMYNVSVNYNGAQGTTSFEWNPVTLNATSSSSENYTSTFIDNYTTTTTSTETTTVNTSTTVTSSTTTPPLMNITVSTNATSYSGNSTVLVFGSVTPPPTAPGFLVNIRVISPQRMYVFNGAAPVGPDGTFSVAFPAGMNPTVASYSNGAWTNGTYTVYAYRNGSYATTKFEWNGPIPPYNVTSTTTSYTSTTQSMSYNETRSFQDPFCGLYGTQDPSRLPPSISVAYYAIFANGTLYPVNYTSLILSSRVFGGNAPHHDGGNGSSTTRFGNGMLTFTLAPGQSVTFTYNGSVDSLTGILLSYLPRNFAVPSSLFQINPGQQYTVMISGPFDSRIATIVNATSG